MEENSVNREEKNINGCVIGCISMVVLVPVILIVGAYLVLMHSTVPLRIVGGLANKADGLTIRGIGGSISSGFTIDELRMADEDGHESVMEGLALKWKDLTKLKKSNELIIEEISVDRAHFFFDSDLPSGDDDEESASENDDTESGDEDSFDLRVFELRKVDIREVVFQSKTSDLKVEINEIFLKGLRIEEDEFTLEDLSVGSNFVDLQLDDATVVEIGGVRVPFTRQVRGALKSIVHPSVLKDIDFTIDMGAMSGDMVIRVRLFGDAVEIFNPIGNREGFAIANHFSAADYFAPELTVLPDDLSITIRSSKANPTTGEQSTEVEGGGTFTIGTATFVIPAQVLQKDNAPIVAHSNHAGHEVTATIHIAEQGAGFRVELESQPIRKPRELMTSLLYEKIYDDLDLAAKEEVDASVQRFDFPNSDAVQIDTEKTPDSGQ